MQHLVRDPVHRTIPISSGERSVIDHPLFQRLRRIKQTAFLYLVFPGASHDRFSHSIGAMHMAGLAFNSLADEFTSSFGPRALQPSQKDFFYGLLRLAALLHDVGHGPFSHSLEGVTNSGRPIHPTRKALLEAGDIPNHWISIPSEYDKKKWLAEPAQHEEFSIAIIAKMADRDGFIAGLKAQDIAALLTDWVLPTQEFKVMDRVGPSGKWSLRKVLKSLVTGELDCDRMDYLLRDSHYTGVPYGQYDREMILENMMWRPDPKSPTKLALCLRRKALHALEDFLISRYHMFLQLYSHKTVVGFDVVLENALAELPEFSINPSLEDYVLWSDDWVLRKILENRASRWGMHIRDRKPLKTLFTVRQQHEKTFHKFIKKYEVSKGTTAWFPSLKTKTLQTGMPRIWWRHTVSYLTKQPRGSMPIYIEDRKKLVPLETVSLLLSSDYVRRFEMTHVYCLKDDTENVISWLGKKGLPKSIFETEQSLLE